MKSHRLSKAMTGRAKRTYRQIMSEHHVATRVVLSLD